MPEIFGFDGLDLESICKLRDYGFNGSADAYDLLDPFFGRVSIMLSLSGVCKSSPL